MSVIEIKNIQYHKPTQNDTYVGRGSPLGNPNSMSEGLSRQEAIEAYEYDFNRELRDPDSRVSQEVRRLAQLLIAGNPINLVCHCSPLQCHAEIIKKHLLSLDIINR